MNREPFVVGFYDIYKSPGRVYDSIWDFEKLYPDYVQISMPSLYVGGSGAAVAEKISQIRSQTDTNDIIPWLTPGTYGEFPQRMQRDMILETFCNGGNGITYYKISQADPLELRYIADTIELVRPMEDIIADGIPIADQLSADSEKVKVCGMADGEEALILVSCYDYALPVEATVTWDGVAVPVFDAESGQLVGTTAGFTATVEGANTKLYYAGSEYATVMSNRIE
jgi:hypothetical protein